MIKISHNQASDRFDSLPESLKEAGISAVNTAIIQGICDNHHLTFDKFSTISKLVGYILFGFIHPEDLAKETREELNIVPELASLIASEIDKKIFTPIRTELEKNYAPLAPETPGESAEPAVPPESIIDLKAKSSTELGSGAVAPKIETALLESTAPSPAAVPVEPIIVPTPITPEPQKPLGELSGEPAPVIIHQEAEFKPVAGETTKRSLGGIFGFMTPKERPSEPKPVTARIEMTGLDMSKTGEAPIAKTEPPKIRVVHYTDFRTPISPFDATQSKPIETPEPVAKPPVSAPAPPPSIPVQPQLPREEIKMPESPSVVGLRQPQPESPEPFDVAQGKPSESLSPPFEPLRKPEEIKPFESAETFRPPEGAMRPVQPIQPLEPLRPAIEPKIFEPGKPSELPKAPEPPTKPGDEGDIIDLRTFESVRGTERGSNNK